MKMVCTQKQWIGWPLALSALTRALLENATKLVEVTANLGLIATFKIPTIQGADGHMYYRVDYEIAIIFNSGDTVYELVHDNINYGRVASEYV